MRKPDSNAMQKNGNLTAIVFIVATLSFFQLTAQVEPTRDELLKVLDTGIDGKKTVDTYVKIAASYSAFDSANTLKYANRAIELSGEIQYLEGEVDGINQIGVVCLRKGHYAASKLLYDSLIRKSEKIGYIKGQADSYFGLSSISLLKGEYDLSIDHATMALKIYEEIEDQVGIINTYHTIGRANRFIGKNDQALDYYLRSLTMAESINDSSAIAKTIGVIGNYYGYNGDFDQARDNFIRAADLFKALGNAERLCGMYNNLGLVYNYKGDYARSLDYYLRSLRIAEELGLQRNIADLLLNIGLLYAFQEEFELAEENYRNSLVLQEELGNKRLMALINNNLGSVYKDQFIFDKALTYYFRSVELYREIGSKQELAYAYNNIGHIYQQLGNAVKSLDYTKLALALSEEINDQRMLVEALIGMGNVYFLQENWKQSKFYYDKGIGLAKSIDYILKVRDGTGQLAIVESRLGNYKAAYEAQKVYAQTADSLKNKENTEKITKLRVEFDFEQEKKQLAFEQERTLMVKNNQIQLLETKENLANLRLTLVLVSLVLIAAFVYFIVRQKLQQKEKKASELKAIGEFKEAMTGMIAHDLKNPLGAIIGTESIKSSTGILAGQMLNLVNNMLDVYRFESTEVALKESSVGLRKLIKNAVEQVRNLLSEKNIEVKISVESSVYVLVDREYILRVLINFLTNAIKYSPNNSFIEVNVLWNDGKRIGINIRDYGQGIPEEAITNIFNSFEQVDPRNSGMAGSTGLGLSFCQLALRAHGSEVQVDSKLGEGSEFGFSLPLSGENIDRADLDKREELTFTMTARERRFVLEHISKLRTLKIHEAFEIERALGEINTHNNKKVDEWVEAVLNAAYTNNKAHFDELLDVVEDH